MDAPLDVVAITASLVAITRSVVVAEQTGTPAAPVVEPPALAWSEWVIDLFERAELHDVDVQILRVLLAADVEPDASRLLQRLAGDPTQPGVAVDALVVALRAWGIPPVEVLAALRPSAGLVTRGLVQVHGTERTPPLARRLTLPTRLVDFILTGEPPPALARPLLLPEEPVPAEDLCPVLARDDVDRGTVIEHLRRVMAGVLAGAPLWLTGAPGSGRKTLLATVAAELEHRLVVLAGDDAVAQLDDAMVAALWCELLIGRAILCIADADVHLDTVGLVGEAAPSGRPKGDALAALYGRLRRANLPVVFTSDQPPSTETMERPPQVVRFGGVPQADVLALWRARLPQAENLEEIATRFRLTPGRIVRAAEAARRIAASYGRFSVTHRDVAHAISVSVAQHIAVLGNLVQDNQSWDDIVLPDDTRDSIREMIARVRHRHTVLDEWGFRDKLSKGIGMAALFSGPPGTGKTMVAGIIARELGQELYQIDLSRVVSKWIGETEKNLAKVFDAAEGSNVMLLFDEADSLFAKRTEVKSSNDKHSNAEVNYLLQRVERFEGICILTTNFEGSIDPAFKRRLAFRMLFPLPDAIERAELWRRMIPKSAALADDVDFIELGQEFEIAGGNIKNVVLRAAFLAASAKTPIDRDLLMRAVRLEYRDAGKFTTAGRIA